MKLRQLVCLMAVLALVSFPAVGRAADNPTFFQGLRNSFSKSAEKTFGLTSDQATQLNTDNGGTTLTPEAVVFNIITILLGFLGVIFLVLTIYGGWLWMTAQGNEEQTTKARKIIFDAVVGLLVLAAAYMITYYVGQYVFNSAGLVAVPTTP